MRAYASALTMSALLLTQACGSTHAGGSPTTTSTAPSGAPGSPVTAPAGTGAPRPVDASLVIDTATLKAGTASIRGTLILNNTTGKALNAGCGLKYAVGLTNGRIPFTPAFTMECRMNATLAPGITRYPVQIPTTYVNGTMPIPALPAGTYRTVVVVTGVSPADVRLPGPITVTLT